MSGMIRRPWLLNAIQQTFGADKSSNTTATATATTTMKPFGQIIKFLHFARNDQETTTIYLSDKAHYMKAAMSPVCLQHFQSQNPSRNIASIKGGIIKLEKFRVVPEPGYTDFWIIIDQFFLVGSEGSLTFDEPEYIGYLDSVKKLLDRSKEEETNRINNNHGNNNSNAKVKISASANKVDNDLFDSSVQDSGLIALAMAISQFDKLENENPPVKTATPNNKSKNDNINTNHNNDNNNDDENNNNRLKNLRDIDCIVSDKEKCELDSIKEWKNVVQRTAELTVIVRPTTATEEDEASLAYFFANSQELANIVDYSISEDTIQPPQPQQPQQQHHSLPQLSNKTTFPSPSPDPIYASSPLGLLDVDDENLASSQASQLSQTSQSQPFQDAPIPTNLTVHKNVFSPQKSNIVSSSSEGTSGVVSLESSFEMPQNMSMSTSSYPLLRSFPDVGSNKISQDMHHGNSSTSNGSNNGSSKGNEVSPKTQQLFSEKDINRLKTGSASQSPTSSLRSICSPLSENSEKANNTPLQNSSYSSVDVSNSPKRQKQIVTNEVLLRALDLWMEDEKVPEIVVDYDAWG